MSRPLQITPWRQELQLRFPALPASTVLVLALYSFGVILAKASGLCVVALLVSNCFSWSFDAVRKRLSEFYKEAPAKSGVKHGVKRQDFAVSTCFAPLLRWVLTLWSGCHLPLAIDVTNLGDRFHVLCISVVVRGVGIPVAWKVLRGGMTEAWNPHWQILLRHLQDAVPAGWTVIVLSDRGLESPELFRFIVGLGWHPLMRVKKGGKFRPTGWRQFYGLGDLVRQVGSHLYCEGLAYSGARMPCTLLARWEEGYAEPWLLLTDLPPETADAAWYALRGWIEQGFKIIKGGCWDWHKTRMEDPERVERLWLVLAVATLWVVALGVEGEVQEEFAKHLKKVEQQMTQSQEQARQRQQQEEHKRQKHQEALQRQRQRKEKREELKKQQRENKPSKKKTKGDKVETKETVATGTGEKKALPSKTKGTKAAPKRIHRVSTRGLAVWSALWQEGLTRLPQHLHPEPWPHSSHSVSTLSEADFLSQQK